MCVRVMLQREGDYFFYHHVSTTVSTSSSCSGTTTSTSTTITTTYLLPVSHNSSVVMQSDADTMEIMDSDQMDRATAMWAVPFPVNNTMEHLVLGSSHISGTIYLRMYGTAATQKVYAFVVANLDEMLPRLAEGEVAPTQADLDGIFGPVDLGAPSICEMYGGGSDCAVSTGLGVFGVILIGIMIGVAAGSCAGRLCNRGGDKSGYKPVEMSPISRQSSE